MLIALEEKQLSYRSVCVSFSSGVLKAPFFKALNPRVRVPVLVEPVDELEALHGERTIVYESDAILDYLEHKFPEPRCMPAQLPRYAIAQTRLHEANEILSVVGDLVVYLRRFPPERRNAAVLATKWANLEAELNLWESYLNGRLYLVDMEVPYLCDFTLFTNIAYAVRCGLQLDGLYPRLAMLYVRMCARPSIERTWPPHWKTTFGSKVLTKCFYCNSDPNCQCHQQQQQQMALPTISES